jgi:dTDP-4-amino-4,6-dideoxygalactose transaminase
MIAMVDLKYQYAMIKEEVDQAIQKVINDAAFIGSKYAKMFENEFASYLGAKNCVGVSNGTDALEISIEALNLPKGSEIIVPANSFIASGEAVTRNGHKVVFCDCNPNNYTVDIASLKQKITNKTKALVAVHLYGHSCDMDEIKKITDPCNIKIIEDCAQAHGAEYKGKRIGVLGDVAAFSFYPSKNLGAYGDAGAIVTNDDNLAAKARMIGNHGRVEKYDHEFEGRNSRLDGIQAAVLSIKLKHLDEWIAKRIEIAGYYYEYLKDLAGITLPYKEAFAKHVYHLFVIRTEKRDQLQEYLKSKGIETGIHYPIALPKLKAYKYLNQNDSGFNANKYDIQLLSLPMGEHLSKEDIATVSDAVKSFFAE